MKQLLKEPLFHFLAIGSLIFVVFTAFNKEEVYYREALSLGLC